MTTKPPEHASRQGGPSAPSGAGAETGSDAPSPTDGIPRDSGVIRAPAGGAVDALLRAALDEDLGEDMGEGDVTSLTAVPRGARARGRLVAKEAGVLAGLPLFRRVFQLCDEGVSWSSAFDDGAQVAPGDELAVLEGDARALLLAERTALNLLQRLSGIATRTADLVRIARRSTGRRVRILDTRKTTPGLRALEKYAVRCGGGENHRFGLFDQVLLKDNHIDLAGRPIGEILGDLRAAVGPAMCITAEARDADEACQAVRGGADVVLLDNMSPRQMGELVPELRRLGLERGRPLELEASGGIDEDRLAEVARSGVDRISVGSLTHSVSALDLSLYLEPLS